MFYIYPLHDRMGNGPKKVMAHSLGNMVVSNAIQRNNMSVDKYFMLNAAIPSEAFNASLRTPALRDKTPQNAMFVPEPWRTYPAASWASQWHTHFDPEIDDRGKLAWANRFKDVSSRTEVYNYYSNGDEVFELNISVPNVLTNVINLSAPVFDGSFPFIHFNDVIRFDFSIHAWQKQEVLKGVSFFGGTLTAGWAFHYVQVGVDHNNVPIYKIAYTPKEAQANISNQTLTSHSVFDRSLENMINLKNLSYPMQTEIIAGAVPALSSAVGNTKLGFEKGREDDMTELKLGWGRDNDHPYKTRWLHCDLKDMAYFYTWKLFDNLIKKDELQ